MKIEKLAKGETLGLFTGYAKILLPNWYPEEKKRKSKKKKRRNGSRCEGWNEKRIDDRWKTDKETNMVRGEKCLRKNS